MNPEDQLFLQQLEESGVDLASLAVAVVVALAILYFARKSRRAYLGLPELTAGDAGAPVADVSVVIPARNEESVIAHAAGSFPGAGVVVVDDHSTDRTAERARESGAMVITAPALVPGWLGKPNACWAGATATSSPWLLFVDADTWYAPAFLGSLLSYAQAEKLQCLTVFPRQIYGSLAERMLLPYAFGLYFCGVNARAVNNPRSQEALANGQCLLFRREPYEFFHGHRAVAGSVIEDVELARLVKRHRMSLRVMRCESMASVRMYDSYAALWRGFQKNSYRFLKANPKTGIQVVAASISMTSWLPVLVWLLWARQWVAAAVFAVVPAVAWSPWYDGVVPALSAIPAIYLFQGIALSAMFKSFFGFTTKWKGREV